MRRCLLILPVTLGALAVLVAGAAASTAPGQATVHVRPFRGGPRTAFTVSVRIPTQTGTFGQFHRSDVLSVGGPRRPGCVSSARMVLPAATAGSTVRARLVPGHRPAHWCAGTFRGVIMETQSVICGGSPHLVCPLVLIRPQTIGRFRFVVRRG